MGDTRGRKLNIGNEARGGTDPAGAGPTDGPTDGTAAGSTRGPGVSDLLRSRRLSLGYELSEIAVALRIRLPYLEAIEQGRFNDLPGATYAHGFLRTYAEHLGLDPQLVLRRFKEETSGGLTAKPELYLPKPVPESRIPGGALLLLAVVLAGSAYGGWYYINSTGRELVDFVPELPERLASALNITQSAPAPGLVVPVTPPEPPPAARTPATLPSSSPPPAVVSAPTSHLPVTAAPATPAARPPSTTATAAPQAAPDEGDEEEQPIVESTPLNDPRSAQAAPQPPLPLGAPPALPTPSGQVAGLPMPPAVPGAPEAGQGDARVYGATSGQSRIQIRAVQDSWIQVRDSSGDLLMTRVLRPGDVYRVPDKPGLKMQTGNAGGLQVSVDGGQGAPMGTPGQVLRGVQLDPERWAGR